MHEPHLMPEASSLKPEDEVFERAAETHRFSIHIDRKSSILFRIRRSPFQKHRLSNKNDKCWPPQGFRDALTRPGRLRAAPGQPPGGLQDALKPPESRRDAPGNPRGTHRGPPGPPPGAPRNPLGNPPRARGPPGSPREAPRKPPGNPPETPQGPPEVPGRVPEAPGEPPADARGASGRAPRHAPRNAPPSWLPNGPPRRGRESSKTALPRESGCNFSLFEASRKAAPQPETIPASPLAGHM